MNYLTTYKKNIICMCILTIILGFFLHFAYDKSNQNNFVGLFLPLNESVWEHLKLLFIPFTLFNLFFYFLTHKKFSNMLLTIFLGNILGMLVIVISYYLSKLFIKSEVTFLNIFIYILGVCMAYYTLYLGMYNIRFVKETKCSTILGTFSLVLLFTLFIISSYLPIRCTLTKDPNSKSYSIENFLKN